MEGFLEGFRSPTLHLPPLSGSSPRTETPDSGRSKAGNSMSRTSFNSFNRGYSGQDGHPEVRRRRNTAGTSMHTSVSNSIRSSKKSSNTKHCCTVESSPPHGTAFRQRTRKTSARDVSSSQSFRLAECYNDPLIQDSSSQLGRYRNITPVSVIEESISISPFKLSSYSTNKGEEQSQRCSSQTQLKHAWLPPTIPQEKYDEMKERLLQKGKFKDAMRIYFEVDSPKYTCIQEVDSDDGYDTDLDKQLGFDLIADEQSRVVKEDGVFPEYKEDCRKFKSIPNSYFIRHGLDEELRMRYRYLSPGDSRCIASQIKNHLTMSKIDFSNNGIGDIGMVAFSKMLKYNKTLTELNISNNNLGPQGAEMLRDAMLCNYFLLRLDASGNNFGELGGKHCAGILEENVKLEEFVISRNHLGDKSAISIGKVLGKNESLKLLDISWNSIGGQGGRKLAESLKRNNSLEVFLASVNGFGDEGGLAAVKSLRTNTSLKEVDLSRNRITDKVIKTLAASINNIKSLIAIQFGGNIISPKVGFDFLATLVSSPSSLRYIGLEGIEATDKFKEIANALSVVDNITVVYEDPPSKRELTKDILTRNLTVISQFLEAEEMEIEDIFPCHGEYNDENDDVDNEEESNDMLTVADVVYAIQISGKASSRKIEKLKTYLQFGKTRRFLVSELAVVYDRVICGRDPIREQPLRSHLRRSIKEERREKEILLKRKKNTRSVYN